MIHKFISGLSESEKKVLTVAGLIVLLALFDRLLVGPSWNRIKEIDEAIVKEESTIRQNMHFLAYRDRIKQEAGAFKDYYTKEAKAEEEIIAEFLKKVELLATKSNIQLSKISPAGQEYQKAYLKYFAAIDCSGSLENLTGFIYAINNSKELLKVEKMTLGANAKNADTIQANLTISKMIIGPDSSVEAKKLIRIKDDGAAVKDTAAKPEK